MLEPGELQDWSSKWSCFWQSTGNQHEACEGVLGAFLVVKEQEPQFCLNEKQKRAKVVSSLRSKAAKWRHVAVQHPVVAQPSKWKSHSGAINLNGGKRRVPNIWPAVTSWSRVASLLMSIDADGRASRQ
jgi:hypothetical protein